MLPARCERCMRFKIADRILFCQRCTARGAFRQDVTIYGPTARVMIVNGVVEFPDSELGWAEMRAVVKVGKRKLTAKRLDDKPYHDRQRRELVTMVTDQLTDYYRESWYHPESREDHVKIVPLKDQQMHGPGSASRFRKIIRPPRA